MTMADLEALAQLYFPSAPPQLAEQGRAGVTFHRVESNTLRSSGDSLVEQEVTQNMMFWRRPDTAICPVCKIKFEVSYGVKHVYCSKACKQKAYRQRKKKVAA